MAQEKHQAKIIKFPAESVILREGEVNLDMYKIVQGHAEVYVGYETEQETLLGILGPKSCFGEFGLLLQKPAIYTVVAYSDLYAMRITEGEMGDFVQENHHSIIEIMRNMASTMMTLRFQIDLLVKEVQEGHQPDEAMVKQVRKSIAGYGLFNPNDPRYNYTPKMHFLNRK